MKKIPYRNLMKIASAVLALGVMSACGGSPAPASSAAPAPASSAAPAARVPSAHLPAPVKQLLPLIRLPCLAAAPTLFTF